MRKARPKLPQIIPNLKHALIDCPDGPDMSWLAFEIWTENIHTGPK